MSYPEGLVKCYQTSAFDFEQTYVYLPIRLAGGRIQSHWLIVNDFLELYSCSLIL